MGRYELQLCRPEQYRQIAGLRREVWGGSVKENLAYLEWKYLRNPYVADPLIYVALRDKQVVGMRGMVGTSWVGTGIDGRLLLPCAADAVIKPEHREGSLFRDLNDLALEDLRSRGFSHAINMSATPANYVASVVTMGWRRVGRYGLLTRNTRPRSSIAAQAGRLATRNHPTSGRAIMPGTVAPLRAVARRARRLRRRMRTTIGSNPFRAIDARAAAETGSPVQVSAAVRPDAMADLVTRLGADGRLGHIRDTAFLGWRYQNPRLIYRFLYRGGKHLDGYLVLKTDLGGSAVHIVDWAGPPAVFSELLQAALDWGDFPVVGIWSVSVGPTMVSVLQEAGFVAADDPASRHSGMIIRGTDPAGIESGWSIGSHDLLDIDTWDLRMIFSDGF